MRGLARADRLVPIGLAIFAGQYLVLGVLMAFVPGTFYEVFGPFGPRNDHYIRDTATYNIALAALLALAIARHGWRLPMVALVTLQFALHTVNHLVDIGEAEPVAVGVADFVALLLATVLLVAILRAAHRDDPAATAGTSGPSS